MKQKKKLKIIGLTTDPYDTIYGYSLVFYRFFDYLQKNNYGDIKMFSNDGVCSTIVQNRIFETISLNKDSNLFIKTIRECIYFYEMSNAQPKEAIFVVNCEIPELIVGTVLSLQGRKVFCIFQDDRVRKSDVFTNFICNLRMFLLRRNKHVLFTNAYTQSHVKGNFASYYLGNPVF